MKTSGIVLAGFSVALFGLNAVAAQEQKIKRSELPAAVEKTVAAQSQGVHILVVCGPTAFVNSQAQFHILKFRCRQNINVSVRKYSGNLPLGFLNAIGGWRMTCER